MLLRYQFLSISAVEARLSPGQRTLLKRCAKAWEGFQGKSFRASGLRKNTAASISAQLEARIVYFLHDRR